MVELLILWFHQLQIYLKQSYAMDFRISNESFNCNVKKWLIENQQCTIHL